MCRKDVDCFSRNKTVRIQHIFSSCIWLFFYSYRAFIIEPKKPQHKKTDDFTVFTHFEWVKPPPPIRRISSSPTPPPWKTAEIFTEFYDQIKRRPAASKRRRRSDATGGSYRRRPTTSPPPAACRYDFADASRRCRRLAAYLRWLSPQVSAVAIAAEKYAETARPLIFNSPHRRVFLSGTSQQRTLSWMANKGEMHKCPTRQPRGPEIHPTLFPV
jgi:hypothetical protein